MRKVSRKLAAGRRPPCPGPRAPEARAASRQPLCGARGGETLNPLDGPSRAVPKESRSVAATCSAPTRDWPSTPLPAEGRHCSDAHKPVSFLLRRACRRRHTRTKPTQAVSGTGRASSWPSATSMAPSTSDTTRMEWQSNRRMPRFSESTSARKSRILDCLAAATSSSRRRLPRPRR
jgi:hypothetical protein